MFYYRGSRDGEVRVEVGFTDSSLDLQGLRPGFGAALAQVEQQCAAPFARVNQVHGSQVLVVDGPGPAPQATVPTADALVSSTRGLGLMVRVADCVPVLLADPDHGVLGAVHSGRAGLVQDIVTRTVERMRTLGASALVAWIGPHVCGGCYEVPDQLQAEVAARVPAARARTTWGSASLDLGAGVRAQLEAAGVEWVEVVGGCTREEPALHSFRRDGAESGRFAGLVWTS